MTKLRNIIWMLLIALFWAGCAPADLPPATPIPSPTNTSFPTATQLPAPIVTLEPATLQITPEPRAIIRAETLSVFPLPDRESQPQGTQNQGEELEIVGQTEDCAWIKIRTAQGLEGWVSGDNQDIRLSCKCSCLYEFSPRPENGTVVLDNRSQSGKGNLLVENKSGSDGLIILLNPQDQIMVALYVRSAETATLNAIPNESYRIFFTTGTGWSVSKKQFQEDIRLKKFESIFTFATTGNTSPIQRITLQSASESIANTTWVDSDEFPKLE